MRSYASGQPEAFQSIPVLGRGDEPGQQYSNIISTLQPRTNYFEEGQRDIHSFVEQQQRHWRCDVTSDPALHQLSLGQQADARASSLNSRTAIIPQVAGDTDFDRAKLADWTPSDPKNFQPTVKEKYLSTFLEGSPVCSSTRSKSNHPNIPCESSQHSERVTQGAETRRLPNIPQRTSPITSMCQAPPPMDMSQDLMTATLNAQLFRSQLLQGSTQGSSSPTSVPFPLSVQSMDQINSILGLQQVQQRHNIEDPPVKVEQSREWASLDLSAPLEEAGFEPSEAEQKFNGSADAVAALPAEPIRTLLSAGVRIQGRSTRELLEKATHIRQRRRESAARSRQRRAKYFVDLEEENKHLRDENRQLKLMLRNLESQSGQVTLRSKLTFGMGSGII